MVLVPSVASAQLGNAKIPPAYRIDPPEDTDLVDLATGDLDTACRHSGTTGEGSYPPDPQLEFQIAVGRYVGPTDSEGRLIHAAQMVQEGTLGAFAELTFMFFENTVGGCAPPPHRIMYNGQWVADENPGEPGTLQNLGRGWAQRTFRVPIERVRFPAAPGAEPGVPPIPAVNDIHIEWANPNTCLSCFVVDWVSQRVRVVSPVILIHGTGQSADWWSRHLSLGVLLANRVPVAEINFAPNRNTCDANALRLQYLPGSFGINPQAPDNRVRAHAARFGANSVHLLCHSKGGLDARRWIHNFIGPIQPVSGFRVLSLMTLSTPHNGSALADWSVGRWTFGGPSLQNLAEYHGFPVGDAALEAMSLLSSPQVDYRDLRTFVCSAANATELPLFPGDVSRCALAADMDENRSGAVDQPVEVREIADDTTEYGWFWLAQEAGVTTGTYIAGVNRVYQILKSVDSINFAFARVPFPPLNPLEPIVGKYATRISITGIAPGGSTDSRNDGLVTISSGVGRNSFADVGQSARIAVFEDEEWPQFPTDGRNATWAQNHSSIGGQDVAVYVFRNWIVPIEREAGGMR